MSAQDLSNLSRADHDRLPDRYVVRNTVRADSTEKKCYFCVENWQTEDEMIRLRCCDHWLHEDCLSKSILLDDRCSICRIDLDFLNDETILHQVAEEENTLKVRELLNKQTSCTTQDFYDKTSLHAATLHDHEEMIKMLLDHEVDAFIVDYKKQTALHIAAQSLFSNIVTLLVKEEANITTQNCEEMTALHFAYQRDLQRTIDCLLKKWVKTNIKNQYDFISKMLHQHSSYSTRIRLLS